MANWRIPNDEPTLDDSPAVGCFALVERVAGDIQGAQPPQVFGVHGEWGAGKTSFLHQLQHHLTGSCPQNAGVAPDHLTKAPRHHRDWLTVIWFEAWRYQNESAPIVALLHEIRTQLSWAKKALGESKKQFEVLWRSAALSLEDLTGKIGIQVSKIEQTNRDWNERHLASQLPSHIIREQLHHALKTLIGGKAGHKLVVLVDDLDRCEPEAAFRLLEGIKIYLNLPSCVFVLAMNQRIVEEAVAKQLPGNQGEDAGVRRRRAKDYLEKLCTSVYHLPLVREPGQLLKAYLGAGAAWEELCQVVAEYGCLPRVPRKIKGYASLLLRFQDRLEAARAAGQKADPGEPRRWAQIAVIFTYLYHFEHELYRHLWAELDFYRLELLPWARGRADKERPSPLRAYLSRFYEPPAAEAKASLPEQESLPTLLLDPVADNVLHIQRLIAEVPDITTDEWKTNLLG